MKMLLGLTILLTSALWSQDTLTVYGKNGDTFNIGLTVKYVRAYVTPETLYVNTSSDARIDSIYAWMSGKFWKGMQDQYVASAFEWAANEQLTFKKFTLLNYFSGSYTDAEVTALLQSGAYFVPTGAQNSTTKRTPIRGWRP